MKKLLEFLITKITGKAEGTDFTVEEITEGDRATLAVTAHTDIVGLIIGKEGKTIKNIRKIVAKTLAT